MNTSGTGSPKGDEGLDEEVFWEDGQRYVRDRLGNVYIEEVSPEREVDEKTRKVLEERERNRIRRERREAKHRAPGYEPPEGSDVSTDSQLSEDEQERIKAIRKERKRQEIKATKMRKDKAAANRMARQIREERQSTAVIVSNIKHPRIIDFDREFLVEWKKARLEYERQLDELAKHHGARALDPKMGYCSHVILIYCVLCVNACGSKKSMKKASRGKLTRSSTTDTFI
ncbi:hypothetical protein AC1031_000928 [Aphanomyces cochlioides]|nr:hypothetical protein AC1031_000928 [Aphanomyces cochlioides]